MATILDRGDGRRAIQFENLNGERKTLGLGKCPAKSADTIKIKIEAIIASRIAQESFDSETARWISALADSLHERLSEFGLIEPRGKAKAASQTVAQFVSDFITGRVDVKRGTVTNYRQAEAKLVEFFGTKKLASVNPLDADKFRSWLKGDKATNCGMGLAEDSARSIVKNAKLIFGAAMKGKLIVENPFAGHSTAISNGPTGCSSSIRTPSAEFWPNVPMPSGVPSCRYVGLVDSAARPKF